MSETAVSLDLLATFVAVAEAKSFSRAADKLGITKGTVSRGIARLEEIVGAELIHRTTHRVALSTAGTALYERTAPHIHALGDSVQCLPEIAEAPSGRLRITVPHDFGAMILPELLVGFSQRYPQISIDVRVTNDEVDLVAEGFDLAIRATSAPLTDSTLIARRLGTSPSALFASPGYLARRGEPKTLGDPEHDWLAFRRGPDFLRDVEGVVTTITCDDMFMLRQLVVAGAGIGLLPMALAHATVLSGEIVRVLRQHEADQDSVLYLVYPSSGQVPRKLEAFRDFLVDSLPTTAGAVAWLG